MKFNYKYNEEEIDKYDLYSTNSDGEFDPIYDDSQLDQSDF